MVTIRDVASAAGVSIATVSRVFNDSSRVSPAAARRVRSAASRLDYWPNVAARSLTTSRSHAIGVLLPDLFGEFFSEVIRGIDQAARSHKHTILISSSHADAQEL
jgi:LacI family transcriptional regulator